MKNKKINKKTIKKSTAKMLSDKKIVRSYIKGNTSKDVLLKKGIKLASPL